MADPRVTVGLAVYNGEQFLAEALRSLVEQDFEDMEILIADNASTDGTMAICEEFAGADPRVRILRSDRNRGLGWNHDRLVPEARGEYFKWAACDDRYRSTFVSACVRALDADPGVVLAYTNTVDIDADGVEFRTWPTTSRASQDDPAVRFRDVMQHERQCFPIYGLMRAESLRGSLLMGSYAGSDQPLLAQLALRGRFVEIEEPLLEHREHAGRSIAVYPNQRDRVVLYHPDAAGKVTFPKWRMAWDYARVISTADISLGEKLRASVGFGPWARMWWRPLVLGVPGGVRYAWRQRRRRVAAG